MLSGGIYTLIGIKNKAIQIFISTAYLIALAITVLLLYVIDPPISNAVQGAYFVAAFVPAAGIGGLSLIFKDVTEGLGAAAGGFALSMWFLVLKSGGVLTNTASKAAFIGCWTVGIYVIYFSHHIRSYVIIGATSFAGATALILGIDCFSLAGLKEFWVYIWALNGKLFPPKQNTYPITRGMVVEIAGIVIFTFFGILSQLKIWKIVQARREKKDLERSDGERLRDEEEAEIGRRLEADQVQERKEWERVYGDKGRKKKDSVMSTEIDGEEKRSTSVSTKEVGEVNEAGNNQPMPSTTSTSKRSSTESKRLDRQFVVPIAIDDITPGTSDESQAHSPYWTGPTSSAATSVSSVEQPENKKAATRTGPAVVPLPFQIPTDEPKGEDEGSQAESSLANTKYSSEGSPKKGQGHMLPRVLSSRKKRLSVLTSTSVEAQADDWANTTQGSPFLANFSFGWESSDAVPLEDLTTSKAIDSEPQDPVSTNAKHESIYDSQSVQKVNDIEADARPWALHSETEGDIKTNRHSMETSQNIAAANADERFMAESSIEPRSSINPPLHDTGSGESDRSSAEPASGQTQGPLQRALSADRTSKVVLQFRTNEWAKHLGNAEKPGPEEVAPSIHLTNEPVSTVNKEELLKTPLTAEPAPAPVTIRKLESVPNSKDRATSSSTHSKQKHTPARIPSLMAQGTAPKHHPDVVRSISSPGHSSSKRPPMRSESKRQSQRSPFPPFQASRNSLITSPIAEDAVASFPPDSLPGHHHGSAAIRSSNRLSRRSVTDPSLDLKRYLAQSPSGSQTAGPTADITAALSDDNISLSKRKSYLRQSSSGNMSAMQIAHAPSSSPNIPKTTAHLTQNPPRQQTYPPSQPQVQSTIPEHTLRRASMLAEWRRSKSAETHGPSPRGTPSPGPQNPIPNFQPPDQGPSFSNRYSGQSNGSTWGARPQLSSANLGMIDSTVYSGKTLNRRASVMSARDMDNAHREVLRKMQAGANKALARDDRG